jgi:cell division protein FtsQ
VIWKRNKNPQRGAVTRTPAKPSRPQFPWRRLLPLVWGAVMLLLMVGAYPKVIAAISKPVDRVAITGELRFISREEIIVELRPLLADGFWLLELATIQQQLQQHQWVEKVRVKRRWPADVLVEIYEQRPIAHWGEEGFLNHRGELFKPANLPQIQALPILAGPDDKAQQVMTNFRELADMLRRHDLQLTQLTVNERDSWRAVISNVEVVLGSQQVMDKMQRFLQAYRADLAPQFVNVERIDMRYSNGLAVAWKEQQQGKS